MENCTKTKQPTDNAKKKKLKYFYGKQSHSLLGEESKLKKVKNRGKQNKKLVSRPRWNDNWKYYYKKNSEKKN